MFQNSMYYQLGIMFKIREPQYLWIQNLDTESCSQKNINTQSGLSDLTKKNIGYLVKFAFQMKQIMVYYVYPHVIFGICFYF